MTEEQKINEIAEKRVKEWIEYAKKEYGWENAQYDLFEEPMFELCVQVATLTTKELEKENKTLEGCLLAEQEHTLMLEKQIEKMKCCLCVHCGKDCDSSGCGNPCDRWEFAE